MITNMHVFGGIAYAMVSDKNMGKLDVEGTKWLFLEFFDNTKA